MPQSDCANLAFDQATLRSVEDSIDLSQGPSGVRSALNAESGIKITACVLSDGLLASGIKTMPEAPNELVLGGSNKQARIGTTKNDKIADVSGRVKIKNDSTATGAINANGGFKLKGGSAVAGDITVENSTVGGPMTVDGTVSTVKASEVGGSVEAADVDQLKDARISGDVTATDGTAEAITITRNNEKSVVCGNVETDGRVEKNKELTGQRLGESSAGREAERSKDQDWRERRDHRYGGRPEDQKRKHGVRLGQCRRASPGTQLGYRSGERHGRRQDQIQKQRGVYGNERQPEDDSRKNCNDQNNSTVGDPIDAAGRVEKIKNSTVKGNVTSGGDAKIKGSNSTINGSVTTKNGGSVTINSADINGSVDADGKVIKIKNASITGGVTAGGPVEKIKGSTVERGVTAGGDVKVKGSTTGAITTTADSGGDLTLESSSTVEGPITLDGEVTKIKGSTVKGGVTTGGDVEKIKNSRIEGTVDADGDVLLKGSTTVTGDVVAGGRVTVSGSVTVKGTTKENQ